MQVKSSEFQEKMQSAIRITIILFIILELVHCGFGLLLMKINIAGPSDIKDYVFGPLLISSLYFLLTTIKTNLNKSVILGLSYVFICFTIIVWIQLSNYEPTCIDCPDQHFLLSALSGLVSSASIALNYLVKFGLSATYEAQVVNSYVINMILVATYLMYAAKTASFIEDKFWMK